MEYEWRSISGRGRIISWTVFHRTYLPAYPAPHLVVAVQLEEGPIMVSSMNHEVVDQLRLDAPVRMIYVDHPDGYRIPSFAMDDAA
ncbi:Zn-ribbon domain-containing OB-fold protein [Allopusillimonas soli]|nr:OB-fold domain-containing protein [Allopusillimonas soli]